MSVKADQNDNDSLMLSDHGMYEKSPSNEVHVVNQGMKERLNTGSKTVPSLLHISEAERCKQRLE